VRYLAIDLGDKRTGLAVGHAETGIITPLKVIALPNDQRLIDAIVQEIKEHQAEALVLGLPLNMDDTEGPRAQLVRRFADQLKEQVEVPIHFQDERLTSFAAEQSLARTGKTHKQKKDIRDALAAVEILHDFFESSSSKPDIEE